jgi:hypothetical protein
MLTLDVSMRLAVPRAPIAALAVSCCDDTFERKGGTAEKNSIASE